MSRSLLILLLAMLTIEAWCQMPPGFYREKRDVLPAMNIAEGQPLQPTWKKRGKREDLQMKIVGPECPGVLRRKRNAVPPFSPPEFSREKREILSVRDVGSAFGPPGVSREKREILSVRDVGSAFGPPGVSR